MDLKRFTESLQEPQPPAGTSLFLQALWFDAKGMWEQAHELIQDGNDKDSSRIHAYLHRKEGDQWNADWWYRKAGVRRKEQSLQEEWEQLVQLYL
jgi:hypothetical protein